MVKEILKTYCLVIFYTVCLISCTKEIDFSQAEEIELSPIVENSLIFFDAPASEFFVGGTEVSQVSDFVEIDIFNNSFIINNLAKAEFVFEVVNSINRSYKLQVDFLDGSDTLLHTFTFSANASPNNTNVLTKYTEVFEGNTLRALKNTVKLSFTLTMLPGNAINDNTPGRINLQSKSVFFFNI